MSARADARPSRGFTLIELMVAVVIVGIIAALAAVSFAPMLPAERAELDAKVLAQQIAVAQERYRAERGAYLNVSSSLTSWFPSAPAAGASRLFYSGSQDLANWQALGVDSVGAVSAGCATRAGLPGEALPQLLDGTALAQPAPNLPWFVVQCAAEPRSDATTTSFVATSSSLDGTYYGKGAL